MMRLLEGAKGSGSPSEASDTLKSTQRAEVVDLLSEGPILGLVNGLKSVYLDGVPVENPDGTRNFEEFGLQISLGGPTSEAKHAFGDVQTEVGVGVTVLAAVPVVRTIADATASKVRVTITFPQLVETKGDSGDRIGTAVAYAIDIQSNGGGYVERWAQEISGKASSPFSRAVVLDLTGPAPWDVRVRRVTPDSETVNIVNEFGWSSYTVIAGVQMLYRHTAGVVTTFDAKNFSSVPARWYDVMGMCEWDIPINYDPFARTVSGVWNGLWKQGWTNNPAWVLYNLVKHPRYGLGRYVSQLPDKWTLYELALWCDEMLPDGKGGTEPRYSINAWLVEQVQALKLLQEIASIFRGVLMHGGDTLTVTWDAPREPVASYTPSNVVDGDFTYADGTGAADKKTSCTCWYTDRSEAGNRVPVTWDDPDLVARYGLRPMEIKPIGIATPAQALRMAKWALYTKHYEEETISFRVGAEGPVRRLGEVFQVSDPAEAGERLGGRLKASTINTVLLDAPVELVSGETYTLWVTQPHASDPARLVLESRTVTTAAGTVSALAVTPNFTAAPLAHSVWLLEGSEVAPTLWRYAQIREVKGDGGAIQYEVLGTRHEPGKWALVEADQPLTPRPTRRLPYGAPKVASITIEEEIWFDDSNVAHIRATASWPMPAPGLRYVVRWRVDMGPWVTEQPTSANTIEGNDLRPGLYEVQVQSLNALGQLSAPTSASALLTGDTTPTPDVEGLRYSLKLGQVWLQWDAPAELRWLQTVLRVGGTGWDDAEPLWEGAGSDYKHPRPPNGTYTVWAKHRRGNRLSVNAVSLTVTVDDSIDGGGSGTLKLSTSRFPFFLFATGTSHVAIAPGDEPLTIIANLVGLFGTANIVAEAFDARTGGASLGPVTLGGTGNARTISAAQFVAAGTLGSVRRVHVTATLGGATDELDIYRHDSSVVGRFLFLSNPHAAVATDEAGEFGDYSSARTNAVVFDGLDDVTPEFDFAISPDDQVDAEINGEPGPVSNPSAVEVAVLGMGVPTGAVLIEATDGTVTLSASFVVDKREASGTGYTTNWDPRDEVVLPVDGAGAVLSFDEAFSELHIIKGGQLDDTANWTQTKEDVNVVSTLTGARVDITSLLAMGSLGSTVSTSLPWSANGWSRVGPVIDAGDWWLATGFNASAPFTKVERSPKGDFGNWSTVDHGVSGQWNLGDYAQGAIVLAESAVGSTNKTLRSVDGGATWSNAVALPTASQWYHLRSNGSVLQLSSQVSTTGAFSTNGGASWSSRTYPATGLIFFPGPGAVWASRDTMGNDRISLDNGATWSLTETGLPGNGIWDAKGFAGRLVATAWADTDKVAVWEPGTGWVLATLPEVVRNGQLSIVRGVLYLIDSNFSQVLYSYDGKSWKSGASTSPADSSPVIHHGSLTLGFIPDCDSTSARKHPLLATSDNAGSVIVTSTKPGELPIRTVLPVRKASAPKPNYVFAAFPATVPLPATADGIVLSFANASITVQAWKDGVPDPSWTWTWTATHLTPSSGTGATATFTAMDPAQDTGYVHFVGSKPGETDIPGTLVVWKVKGTMPSGPIHSAAFDTVAADGLTYLGLKFKGDGMVQVKKGTGGAWVDLLPWAVPPANYTSMHLRVGATGHPLTTGTTGVRLPLTTDREFAIEATTPGTYKTNLEIEISSDNVGSNTSVASASLRLNV